ncbi:Diacylglycerol kinase epsilon [Chionoecetes opilio]|uniref:Diacylglycerol kinase n=1 Tax=Chionoecetes opilio TaxID=41210 RepID=A0A8J5D0D0_CHIOP|nr:Diacylglycerol kinase epsilon [Chionoecetes opilio]
MSEGSGQMFLWVALSLALVALLVRLSRRPPRYSLRARDVHKGHCWCSTHNAMKPSFCSICETLINVNDGSFCNSCGVCADTPQCISASDRTLPCKVITTRSTKHKHHWIRGNLPLHAQCQVCEEDCGTDPQLTDWWCCWCRRCAHDACIQNVGEVRGVVVVETERVELRQRRKMCDFGKLRECVVPPNCISLKYSRIKQHLYIKEVLRPKISGWSPVIVMGNTKSGSSEADAVLSSFCSVLNPAQVIDLNHFPPEEALMWCHLLPPDVTCRVVVAGGDGTVCWVLSSILKMKFERDPHVAILPLGTGNDLSRVLGFGGGLSWDTDVVEYLQQLNTARPALLDCWRVHFTPARSLNITREVYMYNYLSVGVDALVTLNFHRARQSPFYLFSNRLINKMIYFSFGTKDVLEHMCKDLDQRIELFMDDRRVSLPSLESLVVLNIACWGAGCRPWTLGGGGSEAPQQNFSDGLMEVICLSSSLHIAQLHVGLGEPTRLGQCSSLRVSYGNDCRHVGDHLCLKGEAPMQVDGEPWKQSAGTITLRHSKHASVLMRENS